MAGRGRKGQDSKPDLGEPAVRGLSGGLGKRGHGGNVNPPRNRKGESGNARLQQNALELYPNRPNQRL
jgi:hypothetical protein